MKSTRSITLSWLIALLLIGMVSAAPDASGKRDELNRYLQAAHDVLRFHGTALVAVGGEVVLEEGYGKASIELDVPNEPKMKFLIGSITKQFTAAAILQLRDRGKLEVSDPITEHLPEYPSDPGDRITIHHLLSHTSGIPSYTDKSELMSRRALGMPLDSLMLTFMNDSLQFEPGEEYYYTNSGYVVLGAIIEAVSGQDYATYVREHIFEPVGMQNTGYGNFTEIIPDRACGYFLEESGDIKNALHLAMSLPYSAGALYSTAHDLYTWSQALYTEKVISDESKELWWKPNLSDYGYGWSIGEKYDRPRVSHGGGIDGFSSFIARWPDDSLCIVVLSNNVSASAGNIAGDLEAIVFDKPYDVPVVKSPIEVDEALLPDYVGPYRVNENEFRVIRLDNGALYSQRSGGTNFRLYPEAKDKFYFEHDNTVTLKFIRGESNDVVAHVIHQSGEDHRAQKVTGPEAEAIMAEPEQADVDPAIFEDYVGKYELQPGFIITVRTRDNRIFTQATGQSEIEIFPSSEADYYLKVVDAQITFQRDENGAVSGLVLHQGGRNMTAPKIE